MVLRMFIDEIVLPVAAGNGGAGVVRWRHEKFKPRAGPAGGDGGDGGDVYVRAVRDIGVLERYAGVTGLEAQNGQAGHDGSKHGRRGEDLYIDVPVGSQVSDLERHRTVELLTPGEVVLMYKGGKGGLGNEHFKSSVNRSPERATSGRLGERGVLHIELSLVVDVGIIGIPNAGKSSLLNTLTAAHAKVGAYPFTTTRAQLGDFYGFVLADIPGLITGASTGKGLGHRFLKHITRTKMILHCVSLESLDPIADYYTIREELSLYKKDLDVKEEWIALTKSDLVNKEYSEGVKKELDKISSNVFVLSTKSGDGVKNFADTLVQYLRSAYNEA
jgi:GTPase